MHSGRTKFYEVAVNYDDVDMKGLTSNESNMFI